MRLIGDDGRAIRVRGSNVRRLKPEAWYQLTFTYDGVREHRAWGCSWMGSYADRRPRRLVTELKGTIGTKVPLTLGGDGSEAVLRGRSGCGFPRLQSGDHRRRSRGWFDVAGTGGFAR